GVQIESEVLDNIESTALIALGTDRDQVDAMLASAGVDARVAMDNCPHQVVVAVAPVDEEKLLAVCRQQAIIAERLAFDRPYHTPAFMPYSQRLLNSLSKLELSSPVVPLYSCATAARVGSGAEEMRELM